MPKSNRNSVQPNPAGSARSSVRSAGAPAQRTGAKAKAARAKGEPILPGGHGRFKTRDGLSLWYLVSGQGPALLLPTPGWGASADMYMKSLTRLEKDFSVIYFDTRGAGRSDAPAADSGYAFSRFLEDLEILRVHLRLDRWLIFAHSAASWQAMEYAINHPAACRGLFIVGGTPNIQDEEYKEDLAVRLDRLSHEPWFEAAKKANDSDPKSDDDFRHAFLGDALPLYFASDSAAREARHYFSASTYHIKAFKYNDNAPKFLPRKLAQIQVPTAVFEGDHDVITTPLEACRLHCGIANSTLFTIRNAGHFPWLQQPDQFFKDFAQTARGIINRRSAAGSK
jgi:pimeloyl-ACP methyl ester carboxylesterase